MAYPTAIIMVYTVGLLLMAEQYDERSTMAREASRAHAGQRTEHDGRREAARLLHDPVLHALHAIGSPASTSACRTPSRSAWWPSRRSTSPPRGRG
ncbi:hypothetical protein GCM10027030_26690 [Luteococcus sediminum]